MSFLYSRWPCKAPAEHASWHRGGRYTVSLIALILCVSGCRISNPAYRVRSDEQLGHSESGQPGSIDTVESTDFGTSSDEHPQEVSSDVASSSQRDDGTTSGGGADPDSQDESSTTQTSSSATDSASSSSEDVSEILKSCEQGAKFCYPVLLDEDQASGFVKDYGKSELNLSMGAHAGMVGGLGKDQPGIFQRTMFTTLQGSGISSSQALTVESDVLGVDVWVKPDDPDAENFTILEIEGVLAIYRDSKQRLSCIYKDDDEKVVARVKLVKQEKFAHLQCSLRDGVLSLRLNGAQADTAEYEESVKKASGKLIVGRAGELSPSGKMKGRIALLRIWEDPVLMENALRREIPYYCREFELCTGVAF